MAGEEGNLTKENFIRILKSSDFFLKSFDKNNDRIVSQVSIENGIIRELSQTPIGIFILESLTIFDPIWPHFTPFYPG